MGTAIQYNQLAERERDELRNLLFLLSAEPETKCSGRYILEMDAF